MHEITLASLAPGDRGIILSIRSTHNNVRQRLLEMGMIRGTSIELIKYAPLGDPIEIRLHGCRLSLRKTEAEAVVVQRELSI